MVVNSVTAIITHYNRPDLAQKALRSIHSQTVMPAEILLVDDHSSPENIKKLKKLSPLATIITTPENGGPSAARNFGAQNAKSEWLAFLDDDDQFMLDKQEREIGYLEDHPNAVALGAGMTMVTPEGHEEYWGRKPTRRLTLAQVLCGTASLSQALMIRRDVFLALGGFDCRLSHMEDFEFGIRLLASGREMHFLAEPVFYYQLGGREQLSLQWGKMIRGEMRVLSMHADLARIEFGPLGAIRLETRCCKNRGLQKGGLLGRSVWAAACALEFIVGCHVDKPSGESTTCSEGGN